jgi:predicted ATP-dependent endonuclease of OLD family
MKREARKNFYRQMHTAAREIYDHGARDEQERIVKLLESKAKHCKQIAESIAMDEFMSEWDSEAFEVESKFALELIELIKGENK